MEFRKKFSQLIKLLFSDKSDCVWSSHRRLFDFYHPRFRTPTTVIGLPRKGDGAKQPSSICNSAMGRGGDRVKLYMNGHPLLYNKLV